MSMDLKKQKQSMFMNCGQNDHIYYKYEYFKYRSYRLCPLFSGCLCSDEVQNEMASQS